tara:strand:+ start:580 stop:912 length:333 start_codon:yes stop_codon:yes gene_type:complete
MPSAFSSAPGLGAIFGLKAFGFRSSVASTASWRTGAFSGLLQQFVQLQLSQCSPEAKHSQYSFKHLELRQLQFRFFTGMIFLAQRSPRGGGVRASVGSQSAANIFFNFRK